jgi:uncharacterized protein
MSLKINVAGLLKASVGTAKDYEVDDTAEIDGPSVAVTGAIRLTRTDRGLLAQGTLKTVLSLNCSRCLTDFVCPLTFSIEEIYYPSIDIITGAPVSKPEDPGTFTIDEHNVLDLTEAVRQYALLTAPMKPLCRTDCAGLCPTCGANRNITQCNCPQNPTDSRWEKLRDFVAKSKNTPPEEQNRRSKNNATPA